MIGGGLFLVGIGATTATGALATPVSVPAAVGGAYLTWHGIDTMHAGLNTLWLGTPQQTQTHQFLSEVTGSPTIASISEVALSVGAAGAGGAITKTKPGTITPEAHVPQAAPKAAVAPNTASQYLLPGIGAAAKGQIFKHAWIKHNLYNQLQGLVGKADFNKFLAALKKGVVGPTGESGIKILKNPVGKHTHELKIGGSAQRLLGYIDENGVLIFDDFVAGGLH